MTHGFVRRQVHVDTGAIRRYGGLRPSAPPPGIEGLSDPSDGRPITAQEFAAAVDRAFELPFLVPLDFARVYSALRIPVTVRRRSGVSEVPAHAGTIAPYVHVRSLEFYKRKAQLEPTESSRLQLELAERWFVDNDPRAADRLMELDLSLAKTSLDGIRAILHQDHAMAASSTADHAEPTWAEVPKAIHELLAAQGRRRLDARGRGLVPRRSPTARAVPQVSVRAVARRLAGIKIGERGARDAISYLRDFWSYRTWVEREYIAKVYEMAQLASWHYEEAYGCFAGKVGTALRDWAGRVIAVESHRLWERTVKQGTETILEYCRARGSEGAWAAGSEALRYPLVWEYLRYQHRLRAVARGDADAIETRLGNPPWGTQLGQGRAGGYLS